MKAVIGVGFTSHCLSGIEAFARLKFPNSEAVLVYTVEPVLPDGGFMPPDSLGPIAQIQKQRKEDGEKKLAEVAAEVTAKGVPCRTVVTFGRPAHEITAVAQKEGADLIVSGAHQKGASETFLMGSVTRALVVEAKRSILVGKQEIPAGDKLSAVFATDHSDYANKCLDHLIGLGPRGLGKITVVSADTSDDSVRSALEEQEVGYEDVLRRKNEAVCAKLRAISDSTESVVLRGRAIEVINAAMEESKADLLILGAHGHGFLERLLIGSVAMNMVGNSPWNTLVIRV